MIHKSMVLKHHRIMTYPDCSQEVETLFQVLERSKEDPWMLCIPLPRVLQIMSQTLILSLNERDSKLPAILASVSSVQSIPKEFLDIITRDGKTLDSIKSLNMKELMSSKNFTLLLEENISLFERQHLDVFKKLGQNLQSDLLQIQTDKNFRESAIDSLAHKCSLPDSTSTPDNDAFLFNILGSNRDLFNLSLSIQCTFLKHCKFSIISVKVIQLFTQQIAKCTNQLGELFPTEFMDLLFLIENPPCETCNPLLSTKADLMILTKQIESRLQTFINKDDELRTILSIYCNWLVHCSSLPIIRSLFINYIK